MGLGTYGRGFTLDDPNQNGLYAPAANPIPAGPYTREAGTWGYNEICERQRAEPGQWTVREDPYYQSPYAFNGRLWVGYDNPESIARKAQWAMDMGLGGSMVWSLETDDFLGICHGEQFVLIKTAFRVMNGEGPPPTTTPGPGTTTGPTTAPTPTTSGPPISDICQYEGYNPDPVRCNIYYWCIANGNGWTIYIRDCPPGTLFDRITRACIHEHLVDCPGSN